VSLLCTYRSAYHDQMPRSCDIARETLLRRGIWLSSAVLIWNVIEGVVALSAGIAANSVALISFGIDASIEILSALVVVWRLRSELHHDDASRVGHLEARAAPVTGVLLLLLALYICIDGGRRLFGLGGEAEASHVGILLTCLSLLVMPMIGWAKLKTAARLNSATMRADGFQTVACAWLSFATLAGLVLNALLGWSWADPLAAFTIVPLAVREGLEAWRTGHNFAEQ